MILEACQFPEASPAASGPLHTGKTHTHPWDRGSQPPGSCLPSPCRPSPLLVQRLFPLWASNLAPCQQDVVMRGQCPGQCPKPAPGGDSRPERWALQGLSYKPGAGLEGPWGSERAGTRGTVCGPRSGVASLGTPDRSAPTLSLSFLLLKTDYWGPSPNVCWKILLPSDDWAILEPLPTPAIYKHLDLGRPHGGCNFLGSQ